jgi:hypothetical protein
MPDVSDYYRVNAALLLVDSALATVLGERPDWKPVHQHHNAVLFMKTELRIKRSVESSPIGRASDRDRARKAPQVLPHADVPVPARSGSRSSPDPVCSAERGR